MKFTTLTTVSLSALLGLSILGCDEKVAEKKTVETTPAGDTVTKKDTVTKEADGDVKRETSVDVDKEGADGDNDEVKVKTEVKKD